MPPPEDKHAVTMSDRIGDGELAQLRELLDAKSGFRLGDYKSSCMKRRIAIRMRARHCRDMAEYCGLLRRNEDELEQLLSTLTINVSHFFRNPSLFDTLRRHVFPGLFSLSARRENRCLRLVSLGCASGEEPYSLAILLREHFGRELGLMPVEITGFDIDARAIAMAQDAEFCRERLKDVPAPLVKRYFRERDTCFRLVDEIREMVVFRCDSLASHELYMNSDMLLCRNTLIYFARSEQERIINGMADALNPHGVLILGRAESLVRGSRRRFRPLDPVERIYLKTA